MSDMIKKYVISCIAIIMLNIHLINCDGFELDFVLKKVNNKNNKNNKYPEINNFTYAYDSFSPKIFQEEELPLINTENNEMTVNLCLGTPKQCFNVLIDSGSFYLWVADIFSPYTPDATNKFDKTQSSSYTSLNISCGIKYGTGSVQGLVSTESLSLGSMKLDKMHFILAEEEEASEGLDGILGLGYHYGDFSKEAEKFSILDQLYENKLISKRIFSQKYINDNEGKLYIGDLPSEIKSDLDNYGNCTALKKTQSGYNNPRWECILKGIFFGYENDSANAKKLEQRALFDTGTNVIICPFSFLNELKKNFFKTLIEDKLCIVESNDNSFFSFICVPYAPFLDLPEINFIFGDWVLKLHPKDLFMRYSNYRVKFIINANSQMDEWVFGVPLLKKFHFVFDKDSEVIGFYGKEDKFRSNLPFPNPYEPYIILLIVIIAVVILGSIISCVIWYIRKKRNETRYYDPSMYIRFEINNNQREQM